MKMKHVGTKQAARMRQIKAHQFAKQYLIVYANAQIKTLTHTHRESERHLSSYWQSPGSGLWTIYFWDRL